MAKKAVAVRVNDAQVARAEKVLNADLSRFPEVLSHTVDIRGWLAAIVLNADYTEPDPSYIQREMALNVLLNPEGALSSDIEGLDKLEEMVDDFPGASTGPIRIEDLYIVPSDIEEGGKTYMILTWYNMETNETHRVSGGGQSVQTQLAACLMVGRWPIECQIVRSDVKRPGGGYMLKVWPVD